MRPALISRTKRRGTTALATALRLFFLKASDMRHLYCALTRIRSALDRDCAANTCHDIEWDDRRWNDCAPPSLSYGAAHPLPRTYTFRSRRIFFGTGLRPVHRGVLRPRTCGPREPRSTRSRSVFRNAYLLATVMRAKFALGIAYRLQTRGDSPVAADRRSRAAATPRN